MTLALDIADDLATIVDGLRAVTVQWEDRDAEEVDHALARAVSTREAAVSQGKYTAGDVAWHVPANEVTAAPEIGGSIIDGDDTWTILEVHLETLANRYRCVCRKLAIYAELDTLVQIQKATWTKGTGGAAVAHWGIEHSGVRAKIQIIDGKQEQTEGRITVTRTAAIYFAAQYNLTNANRIVAPDGTIYSVVSWEDANRIDRLFVANCSIGADR